MKTEEQIQETIKLAKYRIDKCYKVGSIAYMRWNDFIETLEWVLESEEL